MSKTIQEVVYTSSITITLDWKWATNNEACIVILNICPIVLVQVKRPQAKAYFAKAIADMYEEIAASESSGQRVLWSETEKEILL